MDLLEKWMQGYPLQDPDNIDALLDAADVTRQLIHDKDYKGINSAVAFTIDNGLYECFSWIMALLQEEFEKTDGFYLEDFVCDLGRSIANYVEFINRLQVDFNSPVQSLEKVYDEHGEVESFFNNFTYKTRYKNIYLLSSENFDAKDCDYIQYRLGFSRLH